MSAIKRLKDKFNELPKERQERIVEIADELANHSACPCGKSSDAYTEYSDGHGWCYSCGKGFFPESYKVSPSDLKKVFIDGFRGISKETCEKLDIYSFVDEDDNVIFRGYTYPEGMKYRSVHNKNFWVEGKVPALGGTHLWNAGSYHYITVVEGEEDGAAAYQMLNEGKKTTQPVVWLTSAGIPRKGRQEIYDYLSKFETVKIAIENDEAGKKAKSILREMLPNKIREVSLTKHKDANDYLINGDAQEFKRAWDNALIYTPDNIYHTEEDVKAVLENPEVESYTETPFSDLNSLIKGLPLNHVTLITGLEGIGKTEFLRALEYETVRAGYPIAILHHEETRKTVYKGLACYELDKNCRDPDHPVPNEEIIGALRKSTENFQNLFVFEFKSDPDVNTILEQINYLVNVCGVKYIFIDPINQFDPIDDTPKVEFLDDLSKRVAKYVASNPVGMVWTAHVDDEGRTRNSRMISKACSIRIDLKRDILAKEEDERNTTHVFVSKNRPFGKTGYAGAIYFDEETFKMEDEFVFESKEEPDDSIPFLPDDIEDAEFEEIESPIEKETEYDAGQTEIVEPF